MAGVIVTRPLIVGLANGAGFGLVAIGLVLVYKSTRVFNFAAGEFATIGAFGTYLTAGFLPFPLAMLCGVLAGLAAGLLTERLVVRPLSNRAPVTISFSPAWGTTDVLIAAFTAAVLGGMTSVPGAFLGGVLVGVVQTMAQFNLRSVEGANSLALFAVLVAVLLARPTGLLGRE